jgi:hypothetical protein
MLFGPGGAGVKTQWGQVCWIFFSCKLQAR